MTNKKAEGDIVKDTTVYLILLVLFFAGMVYYVYSMKNSAAIWEDVYAKEIAKIINLAEHGDRIGIDVHDITGIALKNEVNLDGVFSFDNSKKEICVKLSKARKSCYFYFNDVNITEQKLELGVPINILKFKVIKGGKNEQ